MSFQTRVSKTHRKFHILEWKIEDFPSIVNKPEMIKSQGCYFENEGVGRCGTLKWKMFLKKEKPEDKGFDVHLKLETVNVPPQPASAEDYFAQFLLVKGPRSKYYLLKQIPNDYKTFNFKELNQDKRFTNVVNPDTYKQFLDDSGALVLNLCMELSVVMKGEDKSVKSLKDFNAESKAKANEAFVDAFRKGEMPVTDEVAMISGDGKEIKGKWAVLAARSPVFATMYESKLSERTTGIIEMKALSGKTLQVFDHFISTGILLPAWKDDEVIVELVNAAAMYQLTDLLEFMDDSLATVCSATTAMRLLSMAQKLSLEKATKGLLEWVKKTDSAEEFLKLCSPIMSMPIEAAASASSSTRRSDVEEEAQSKKRPRRK